MPTEAKAILVGEIKVTCWTPNLVGLFDVID